MRAKLCQEPGSLLVLVPYFYMIIMIMVMMMMIMITMMVMMMKNLAGPPVENALVHDWELRRRPNSPLQPSQIIFMTIKIIMIIIFILIVIIIMIFG